MAGYVSPFDAGNGGTSSRAGNYKSPFIGDPNVPAPMPVPKVAAPVKQPSFLDHVKNVISGARTAGKYELSGAKSFFNDNPIGQTEKGLVQPFIDAGNGVAKQSAYLFGRTSTPAERQAILDNQNKAQQAIHSGKYNPQTMQAITKSAGKGTVQGMIKTHQLLASGASDQQVQQHIAADQKVKANMDKKALGEGAQLASYGVGGGEAAGLKGLAEQGIKDFVIQGGKKVAVGAGAGALGNTGATLAANPNANKKQLATSAGQGGIFGGALAGLGVVGSKVLGKIFGKGADAHLTDVQAAQPTQKLLGAGEPNTTKTIGPGGTTGLPQGNLRTNTGATIPGAPATPTHIPVSEQEYNQRFNALSKSYDKETAAAQKISAPLKQKIVLDDIHDRHAAALAQLDHEFQNGKPNPDYNPGTPHKMVQTGFQIADKNAHVPAAVPLTPSSLENTQVHQRIGQIDAIIHSAQINGANRSPAELRQLMRERQQLEDIASGKVSHESVYGNRPDAALQSAIEIAHNNGNTKLEKELASQLSDQGMNPNASLSPSARQALIDRMRAPSSGSKPLVASQLDADLQDMAKAGKINPTIQHAKVAEMHIGSDSISESLDRKTVAQYKADIQSGRPVTPLVVSKDGAGNTFVQDGAHRLQALKELGIDEAPVVEQNGREAAYTPFSEAKPGGKTSLLNGVPKVMEGDTKGASLNRDYINSKVQAFHEVLNTAVGKKPMAPEDMKKLEAIELLSGGKTDAATAAQRVEAVAKTAKNPDQFRRVAAAWKEFTDTHYATASSIPGQENMGYRQNLLPHDFKLVGKDGAAVADSANPEMKYAIKDGKPSYTYTRKFDTIAQREAYVGPKGEHYVRNNANIIQDMHNSINKAGHQLGGAAFAQGLTEAHPGLVTHVGVRNGTDLGNLTGVPGGSGLSLADKKLAAQYRSRGYGEDPTGFWKHYDTVNSKIKYFKLGGGFFHSLTTAGSASGQQLLRAVAHPMKIPGQIADNLGVIGSTLSSKLNDQLMATHAQTGVLDFAHKAGATISPGEILGDANVSKLDKLRQNNPVNKLVIKPVHDMVFQRQIPQVKLMIMKQGMETRFPGMDFHNPTQEQLMYGRKIASGVNNLGGQNRTIDSWLTSKQSRWFSRGVLATDFTEGKLRTIFNGITKWGRNNPQGTMARQMIFGKSILFALPGLAQLVTSGQLNPHDPKALAGAIVKQFADPSFKVPFSGGPTKVNPNGAPQEAKLPATFISEFGKVIAPALNPLNPDKWSGVKDYASSRLAALPSTVEQLATNRDFFGNPIYGNDKNGNPIPVSKTVQNVANQVLPIPVVQTGKTLTGAQNVETALLNTAGLKVGTDPSSREGQHIQATSDRIGTMSQISKARRTVVNQMNDLVSQHKTNQAQRIAQQFNDSIPQRTAAFRAKYAKDYNPAWDKDFKGLAIPPTGRAMNAREKALKQAQAVLQW